MEQSRLDNSFLQNSFLENTLLKPIETSRKNALVSENVLQRGRKVSKYKMKTEIFLEDNLNRWKLKRTDGEIRCMKCGTIHPNSELRHTYRFCNFCHYEVCKSEDLQPSKNLESEQSLVVLAASYGHPYDASKAFSVLPKILQLVELSGVEKKLEIRSDQCLLDLFEINPIPEVQKVLKIRYRLRGIPAEITFLEKTEGYLQRSFVLSLPIEKPKLLLEKAIYGHPNDFNYSFSVTEILQGMIDQLGGDFLDLPSNIKLSSVFGDPCPGIEKNLSIDYHILGRRGEVREYEKNGHLLKPIVIQATPVVAPLLTIQTAYYGFSPLDIENKLNFLRTQITDLEVIEKKKDATGVLTHTMIEKLKRRPLIEKEIDFVSKLDIDDCMIDVSEKLQEVLDLKGHGIGLEFNQDINLNQIFGDPIPEYQKYLYLEYFIPGLGEKSSEQLVDHLGQKKNFVTLRKGKLKRNVSIEGCLEEGISLKVSMVFPSLVIQRATFGHPTDILKTFDVTPKVSRMSIGQGGSLLEITRKVDLIQEFGEPCRGVRKILELKYEVRTFEGILHVKVGKNADRLRCRIRLGYPPYSMDKGGDGLSGMIERCSTKNSRLMSRVKSSCIKSSRKNSTSSI